MTAATKTWDVEVPAKGTGGGDYDPPPEGNHPAVCVAVIDLGTQSRQKFNSQERENVRMVYLVWELVDLDGNPLVGRDFRVSLHEKSGLRHFVDSWIGAQKDGQKFNLFALAGKQCLLNVKHKASKDGERTFARIEGATPLPRLKGKPWELPAPAHDPVALTVVEHAELPAWVPHLYGRSLKEWLADARENRRQPEGEDGDEYSPDEAEPEDTIPY
jgi:hypothetical protein